MRIAILGQPKTGTTATYFCVRSAMPPGVTELYEKDHVRVDLQGTVEPVLAKVMLAEGRPGARNYFRDFHDFDRRVYIVRDPRDWVVSGALYAVQAPGIYENRQGVERVIDWLRQKEQNPAGFPVCDLISLVFSLRGQSLSEILHWVRRQGAWLARFEERFPGYHTLRYEDFVARRLEHLSEYLGIVLDPGFDYPRSQSQVVRTRAAGNWRSWFTPEDVEVFRELFHDYMVRHGYQDTWALDPEPHIPAEHGSEYVRKLVGWRRGSRSDQPPPRERTRIDDEN